MNPAQLIEYVGAQRDGVVSTLGPDGAPQAAYLAIAASDRCELIFDARPNSRKVANIRRDPRVAIVIGGPGGTTVQCEGLAAVTEGCERERCAAAYVAAFPEFADSVHGAGADADAGADAVVVVRVTLTWARFGDYRGGTGVSTVVDLGAAG